VVLQPVYQFWTAIDGKGVSGGGMNEFQEARHDA
jgi:hypothetical protein